jgi:hypothetical protein
MAAERYHPLVAVDLRRACSQYDAIAINLGNRFRTNVKLKIQNIVDRPESFGRMGGEFRGAIVDRFPFVIIFSMENDTPTIFGVRHAASDRTTWFDRKMPQENG